MFAGLQSHPWAYPVLEMVHIFGIALLLGNLVLLELRVFGRGAALPVLPLARLALTIAVSGFALAAGSGLLMFASQPAELLANRAFTLKMLLILVAGCNALWFHGRNSLARCDAAARAQLVLSTLTWLAVLACGRWIAYR
ncbi:hypothetical protein H8N03_20855 [Ramlibacter sp. USB13]|uniref:Transmembrane protein n=1 Tax=Ramlibacter cellulosilyticus TaxID=2764187 RepID=A0A923SCX5_9BURK|nr:hypothetical protein [Ramlibacter cellulosilyticus]MBC5785410.1 hypothetical protein [Ramlibacter cellulosilyticus]